MSRTGPARPIVVLAAALATIALGGAPPQASLQRETRRIMGTACEVQVHGTDAEAARRAVADALDEMQRVDRLLSNYDAASELSAMNRESARAPFHASAELFAFVRRCHDFFDETRGAFDPTVGPLVRAWGFLSPHPARPSADAIADARARSGFGKVRLDDAARTVAYGAPGLEIDPGGIGKGYAVDMAVRVLKREGVTSALVSAGGSTIYALGHPPDRDAWRVAVGDPTDFGRPLAYVALRDAAVSTSGVSQRFVQEGSHRYSHIFDPRTGEPVEGMCQVSVVTGAATDSDALTKAAFILSRDALMDVLEKRGRATHAMRVEGPCGEGRVIWRTPWSASVFVDRAGDPAGRRLPGRAR